MKISLRQARRVEREIGAETEINSHHGLAGRTDVSIYEDFVTKLTTIQHQTLTGLQTAEELNKIRYKIRKAIETENEVGGINALMNREAELKASAKGLSAAMTTELTNDEYAIATARHAAAKTAVEKGTVTQNRYGEATDSITLTSTLFTSTLEVLREKAKGVQRELLVVVDKLSALNATRTIEIADEDVKTLEAANIIVNA